MQDIFDGHEIVFLFNEKKTKVYLKGLDDVEVTRNSDEVRQDPRFSIRKLKETYENLKKIGRVQNLNELNDSNKIQSTPWNLLDLRPRQDPNKDTYILKFQRDSDEICCLEFPKIHIDDLRIHGENDRWKESNLEEKIQENIEIFSEFLNRNYTNSYQIIRCGIIGSEDFIDTLFYTLHTSDRSGKEFLPEEFKFYLYGLPSIP
jgi:hypothetical protein